MRKKIHTLFLLLLVGCISIAQTSNISGIINIYTPVTAIQCNQVTVSSSTGFSIGDRVLLLQMKGATIDLTNTSSFGSVLAYNDAGNYEFANIASISGNTIYFVKAVLRSYTVSGLVQLIKVPQYTNANIIGTLNCQAWNGSTGGVLVFEATGTVTLNANINASGTGFRGGALLANGYVGCSAMNYYYTLASFQGAQKGEGITAYVTAYAGGRGALADGGGGGNDHNTGGGGGGNYAQGGQGGYQAASCSTSPANTGIGGYAVSYSNASNKIFPGGGGGAGHQNNSESTPGTAGGGIVIIKANTITGNNNAIWSNGNDNTANANRDGAGGGGAGGTILLDILNYTNTLNIRADGGKGGNTIYSPDPLGPGGGGSAGFIWTSGGSISGNVIYSLTGGAAGIAGNGLPRGAVAGQNGGTLTGLILQESNIATQTVTITPNSTTCGGSASTLSASGGGTYSWNTGATTSSIVVSPSSSSSYSVTVINPLGCATTATTSITISPIPLATISGSSTICAGQNATLTAAGGTSYVWGNGATTDTIIVSPTSSASYSVIASNSCGTDTAIHALTVATPVMATMSANSTICSGTNSTLTATGGTNYLWNTGASTSIISVSPTTTTNYSVTISNGFCSSALFTTITVNPSPVPIITGNSSLCNGSSTTLSATGGNSYSWSSGSTGTSIVVNPSVTSTYTVITSLGNCKDTDTIQIFVLPLPIATITGNTTFCSGTNTILTASGGGNYLWNTGATSSSISVSPAANATYSVSVFFGVCADTESIVLTVIPSPTVTAIANPSTICAGSGTTLIANGGGSYLWSNGASSNFTITYPTTTTTYSVIASNGACSDTSSILITVLPKTNAFISGGNSICKGDAATLIAGGGSTYLWSSGETTSIIYPTLPGTYSVIVSNGSCPDDTAAIAITSTSGPTASAFSNVTIFQGQSTELSASGGSNYIWDNGMTGASITVSPLSTTQYCVTVYDTNNCRDTACVVVTIESCNIAGTLYIPNAFSPNADKENDVFQVYYMIPECIQTFHLIIYNRWGGKVYETDNAGFTWDGSYHGMTGDQTGGTEVYAYYAYIDIIDGTKIVKRGNVSLVR